MTNNHPITPPPELVQQWVAESWHVQPRELRVAASDIHIAAQAAKWGSDQELEACCEWLTNEGLDRFPMRGMREARRPKPPSLKEQALKMLRPLSNPVMPGTPEYRLYEPQAEIIRRALEQLND